MQKRIVILDVQTLGEDLDLSILSQFGDVIPYKNSNEDETFDRISDADIVITNKVIISDAMMKHASKLSLICIAATGMNNVDLEAAEKFDILVKNVAGYSTESVVQHTFAMLFHQKEHLNYYDNVVKTGLWTLSDLFTDISHPFSEIYGKKWGIIGLGSIGRKVAMIATAFGAEVFYTSTSGKNNDSSYTQLALKELLTSCDIISIHAPLNTQTYNLINETNLPLLQEGATLLNLGRGGIINETDLAFELDRREIYACLDVLENEPIASTNRLMQIEHKERLLITPHIAWTSIEAREKLLEGIVENISTFLEK